MFEKFERIMNKYLTPVANKIDSQPHLNSVKRAMVAMIPFLLLGSFFAIIPAIPGMLGKGNAISNWVEANSEILNLPVTLSLGFIGLYVTIAIAYFLAEKRKLYVPGAILLTSISFLLLTIQFDKNGLVIIKNFGTKGMFTGIFVAIIAVELYRFCTNKKLTIKMPEGVPDFVSSSFELIPSTLIVVGTFIILRMVFLKTTGGLLPDLLTRMLSPLVGSMDNPYAILFLHFMKMLIFFFGIHPSVFGPIVGPIAVKFLGENIEAMKAGQPLTHIFTNGTSSAFFGFTGAGITIGVVICCLLSKSKRYRKIGQISLFPSLFGINEPILFGAPIILNPIFFIPFVFGGAIVGTLPFFLMKYGFLSKPIFDPPYVGVFLEGFLTNFDYRNIIAQVIQLILAVAMYYPFFKILEKQELRKENEKQKSNEIFSKEDEDILDDLDLDF
ncbi:PTS sugar transporter subunit IIC [Clostridium oceanicum]|uniref:Permease IIC component n=1 Tax=Clostridium oceanicum TaxID=1543 RepID=A0ABN1JLK4_9CLOT